MLDAVIRWIGIAISCVFVSVVAIFAVATVVLPALVAAALGEWIHEWRGS